MAAPGVVISQATAATPTIGSLFNGTAFFLVQRLPSRSSFVERIQANGGRVVRLELQADYIIADHVRKDCPPGSLSYTFIEAAIRESELPDPDDHRAGPAAGTKREVGCTTVPPKGTRTPFTAEDDRVLWDWVEGARRRGERVKGNEIYKQLEDKNPRHTFQAWRDRYIKKLMDRPPPPGAKLPEEGADDEADQADDLVRGNDFTDKDFRRLKKEVHSIELIEEEQIEEAWAAWAAAFPEHTAEEWRTFYDEVVLPAHLEEQESKERLASIKKKMKRPTNGKSTSSPVEREPSPRSKDSNDRATPVPPSASKRKRETPPSRSKAYGVKRPRPDNLDIFSEQNGENRDRRETDQQHAGRTDRHVSKVATFVGGDQASPSQDHQIEALRVTQELTITSEANRAAEAQLLMNAGANGDDHDTSPTPRRTAETDDALPTSEANRASQAQLLAEAGEIDSDPARQIGDNGDLADEHGNNDREQSLPALEVSAIDAETSVDAGLPGFPPNQPGDGLIGLYDMIPPRGIELTEANLASQQAQHKPEVARGKDLPEDDENQDQGDYAEYLQKLMGIKPSTSAVPNAEATAEVPDRLMETPEEQDEDHIELESDRELSPMPEEAQSEDGLPPDSDQVEFPQSNNAEVEDVFAANINWPMSPAKALRSKPAQKESQSQAFETQVQYPNLPFPGMDAEEDDLPSSQPFLVSPAPPPRSTPLAPPEQEDEEVDGGDDQDERSSNIDLTVPEPDDDMDDDEDGEIDLTIPEVGGGFDFSSQEERVDTKPSIDAVMEEAEAQHPTALEVVEIPSDVSSSSDISDDEVVQVPESSMPTGQQGSALDTQAIVNAETQPMDFGMPLPDDSDGDELLTDPLIAPERPRQAPQAAPVQPPAEKTNRRVSRPSTTLRRSTNTKSKGKQALTPKTAVKSDEPEDLNTFVYHLAERGYDQASVVAALRRTSMRQDLAELVVMEEKRGNSVAHVPGVWSDEEDKIVVGTNATKIKLVMEKHGWERYQLRIEFLQKWNEQQ